MEELNAESLHSLVVSMAVGPSTINGLPEQLHWTKATGVDEMTPQMVS